MIGILQKRIKATVKTGFEYFSEFRFYFWISSTSSAERSVHVSEEEEGLYDDAVGSVRVKLPLSDMKLHPSDW